MKILRITVAVIYCISVVVTYGHSRTNYPETILFEGIEPRNSDGMKSAGALVDGIFSPFYWSAYFWSKQ